VPKGIEHLVPGSKVEFVTIPPHIVGKPMQAKIIRIVAEAEAA
jgi:hypothetical protein